VLARYDDGQLFAKFDNLGDGPRVPFPQPFRNRASFDLGVLRHRAPSRRKGGRTQSRAPFFQRYTYPASKIAI